MSGGGTRQAEESCSCSLSLTPTTSQLTSPVPAATAMVIGAMYLLYMTAKLCFGPVREPEGHHDHAELPVDLNTRELITIAPIAVLCIVLGMVPWPILHAVEAPSEQVLAPYPDLVRSMTTSPASTAHNTVSLETMPSSMQGLTVEAIESP